MPPSYEPLPSNDSEQDITQPQTSAPQKAGKQPITRSNLLFIVFGFLVTAFVFYKAGQWSVSLLPSTSVEQSSSIPTGDVKENESVPDDNLKNGSSSSSSASTIDETMPGKYSVGYFVNWGIYGRKFPPSSIPVQDLTHILYAFANINPSSGEVSLSDLWADQDIHYPGDSWNDVGTNLYGNFKAIYLLKKANRHLKLLLSIGGWTYSPSIHPVVVSPPLRAKFVESAVKLLEDYGLDGLDVDYEYPQNEAQAQGYVDLLRELREALDRHAMNKRADYRFLLTIAAPCGPDNYQKLHIREMDRYLDFWNMMAYDFAGSWDQVANHQANLHPSPSTALSVSQCISYYISSGVAPPKLIIGMPLYGRSFLQTQGPGTPFNGVGQGSWEAGVYDYRALPLPGSHLMQDDKAKASWGYDYQKQEMISFDSEDVGRWKGAWIKKMGLGGSMFWELSGDKGGPERKEMEGGHGKDPQPGQSLVKVVKEAMGGIEMGQHNWLNYESSRFDNLRNGMQ
ncbi:glycoside hydrolase superfamily [Lentinula edodes]|uniref:glycoside hydrolase superfamily n=1 Tax=Lentinula edodes TaxID=5353 RepID=UPI001E8D02F4|nr:glycoside hydrolase superfamily [Lentinula edodes]KAH7875319.1 glycoside hydrolase superfamily [Lentinula edodes]